MRRAVLALTLLAACVHEPARLLADIEAGPGPSALKQATPAPTREAFAVPGTEADLYRPGIPARARIVLVPGLSEAGRRDARLVPFAESLARVGFLVVVPDLPAARGLSADASDAEAVAAAVRALPEAPGPAGIAAISYAAGPAFLAALRPEVAPRLDFIATLGAYHDTDAMLTFLVAGAHRAPGETAWRFGRPRPEALWLFVLANAAALPEPRDVAWLREVAEARLAGRPAPPAREIGVGARAVLALADERDPDAVPRRIAALPDPLRGALGRLSLADAPLGRLPVCAILVHGARDPVIPWTESVRLAQALPRARLHLVPDLDHVDPRGLSFAGRLSLLQAAEDLLAARDGSDVCAAQ
ncbi:alpha/beta fold hydrolase [Elioraea sp.]|uniref:alpha/beta fold hydrolase n=1 Tax=Elioraea sp. TaxID=2185103 RepID=UPI003F71659B